tara:strand:- start:8234 stop:8668 length:435 start_codon:yes stop_codon:yes gene_type:complete
MGIFSSSTNTLNKINFEDMQNLITDKNALIINTLTNSNQICLIKGTINAENETKIINEQLHSRNIKQIIIIYGQNCSDDTVVSKYKQLLGLGFTNIYVYPGGMFEWLCLQDIYGDEAFPTTKKELDILKYKGNKFFGVGLLENR